VRDDDRVVAPGRFGRGVDDAPAVVVVDVERILVHEIDVAYLGALEAK